MPSFCRTKAYRNLRSSSKKTSKQDNESDAMLKTQAMAIFLSSRKNLVLTLPFSMSFIKWKDQKTQILFWHQWRNIWDSVQGWLIVWMCFKEVWRLNSQKARNIQSPLKEKSLFNKLMQNQKLFVFNYTVSIKLTQVS